MFTSQIYLCKSHPCMQKNIKINLEFFRLKIWSHRFYYISTTTAAEATTPKLMTDTENSRQSALFATGSTLPFICEEPRLDGATKSVKQNFTRNRVSNKYAVWFVSSEGSSLLRKMLYFLRGMNRGEDDRMKSFG